MKKLHELLNWLSLNKIKFVIESTDDDEGNVFIRTKCGKVFVTFDYEHHVDLVLKNGDFKSFEIVNLKYMF